MVATSGDEADLRRRVAIIIVLFLTGFRGVAAAAAAIAAQATASRVNSRDAASDANAAFCRLRDAIRLCFMCSAQTDQQLSE